MFPFLPILFSEVNFTILHHKFTFLQIYCKVFSQFFLLEFVLNIVTGYCGLDYNWRNHAERITV